MDQHHKAHRVSKRNDASAKTVERHNPKAFTFSGGHISVHRKVQRSAEITQKRLKVQTAPNKASELNPPPFIVVVHGPPGCGKSTLIKCLVKHYSKQTIANLKGAAITCVASKSRRLTLIECPSNDLSAMLDLAKVADLAVCMIDSRRGIELDTLEFISLMRNHGMPRVMGILSHLDDIGRSGEASTTSLVKHSRVIKKLKKKLKSRFWAELYTGAKLFFLSGMKSNKYLPRDVLNLARYISTQRFDPIVWRAQHPHLLMLAMEVDTPSTEELKSDTRTIALSGYIKGSPARDNFVYHIPGCGDFKIEEIFTPADPCPLPTNRTLQLRKQNDATRCIYAPLCDVGQLAIEGDAIYVNVAEDKKKTQKASSANKTAERNEGGAEPQDFSEDEQSTGIDEGSGDDDDNDDDDDLNPDESDMESDADDISCGTSEAEDDSCREWKLETCDIQDQPNVWQDDAELDLSDDNASLDEAMHDTFKEAAKDIEEYDLLNPKASAAAKVNWQSIIYGDDAQGTQGIDEGSWHEFMLNGQTSSDAPHVLSGESYKCVDYWEGTKPSDHFLMATLYSLTANRAKGDDSEAESDNNDDDDDDDDGGEGVEFRLTGESAEHVVDNDLLKAIRDICFATGGWDAGLSEKDADILNGEKGDVATMNVEVDSSKQAWTIPVGTFVRIRLKGIDRSWLDENFKADARPVIVGGVREEENRAVFIQMRCRRHRWSPGILKSSEPLLFSVGWRRFQSLPYFAIEDRGAVRNRYLKYTPEHMHCQGYFHGIAVPPGTGVTAIKHMDRSLPRVPEMLTADEVLEDVSSFRPLGKEDHYDGWRISLTGTVTEITADQPRVLKKIKFIGSVLAEKGSVIRNTAYITGMFNSLAEVSRCLGVPLQTQSGIRGLIKKPHGDNGDFRATFEAPIKANDVIICKAWFRVPMEPFCNPQMDISNWDFLRTFGEVRKEMGLRVDGSRPDSVYKSVEERKEPVDRGPRISARLRKALPFESLKTKENVEAVKSEESNDIELVKKAKPEAKVKFTPYESMVNELLKKVDQKKAERLEHEAATLAKRIAEHNRLSELKQAAAAVKRKEVTQAKARRTGLKEKTHRKKMRLED